MKLSRAGWNNVIIFSVMIIILMINTTNNKLFPDESNETSAQGVLLPVQSVILSLEIQDQENRLLIERVGTGWQVIVNGNDIKSNEQKIEQIILAWQQSEGLMQASEIVIENQSGLEVSIALAGGIELQKFMLYPLKDQLLVKKLKDNTWLAFPPALIQQLLPKASHYSS